jgi:WD40 repeat protein
MNQPDSLAKTYRYAGFISYSQKDKRWARRIHRALETYRLPTGIAQEAAASKRLGRFFRDDDELAGEPSLGNALESALDGAASLIVVCSPNSARSKWVDAEIARFKARGPSARVLAVIVDGQPDHPDPEIMCFAPSMLRKAGIDGRLSDEADEPLAPDVRKEPFNRLIARLVAGLLGLQFDTLWQREQRRIRRRNSLIGGGILIAAVATGVGIKLTLDAERQSELARQQQLRAESGNLATAAQTAMDEGRVNDALVAALTALPKDLNAPDRPVTSSAIAALKRVMNTNHAAGIISRFEQPIEELRLLSNGNLAMRPGDGQVRVLNADSGELIWQSPPEERLDWLAQQDIAASTRTEESPDSNGIYQLQHRVIVRDLLTGKILRQLESENRNWWVGPMATLSPGGALLMVSRTVSASAQEKAQLAIWRVPEVGPSAEPETIDQLAGPKLGPDEMLTSAFIDEQTLMLNWGKERRNIALWSIGSGRLQNISASEVPLACAAQQLDPDPKRTDRISLSANRTLISHARPILNGGWCIALWQAADGSALPPMMIDEKSIGTVDAISADRIVVSRSASSWQPAAIRTHAGDELPLPDCDTMRVSFLQHDVVDESQWLINSDKGFAACINGELIHTYLGRTFAEQHTLHGHVGDVGALAFDAARSRLYSAGDDGSLRAWDFSDLPRNPSINGRMLGMTAHGDRVGLIFKDAKGEFHAQVLNADGSTLSPTIPFEVNIPANGIPQGQRLQLDIFFLAEARSIALLESWDCGFRGCPSGVVNQLGIYRVSDGSRLAHVDDLRFGKFLANIPIAHALSGDGRHLALVKRDGSVIELDTISGAIHRSHAEPGWTTNDVAYSTDVLWVLGNDGAQESTERRMRLTRIAADDTATIATEQRAQSGQLHGSVAGTVAMVEYSLAHLPGIPAGFQLLSATTEPRILSLPNGQENLSGRLESVTFYANDSRMLMLFGKGDDAVLDVDIQSATASVFLASIGAGSLDPWRVDDPLGRVVLSVDDGSLLLLGLPDQTGLCPALSGRSADAAAFSPDGALLALADGRDNKLEVYDLDSCSRVYSAPASVSHNGLLRFAGPSSLWTINSRGQVRSVKLASDPVALHKRARQLRSALGL